MLITTRRRYVFTVLSVLVGTVASAEAVDYEHEPIRYSEGVPDNVVSRLQARLDRGEARLEFEDDYGYLSALLRELQVPLSSQVLVFSGTSLQRHRISPRSPRAIYFNDDVHIGYVRGGLLELAVADDELGIVFYQLSQTPGTPPKLTHMTNNCLTCHGSTRTRNVPGLLVRSVYVDAEGEPNVAAGSFRTDQSSPLSQRWGGWYVSGTHGKQSHLGNFILTSSQKPDRIDNAAGQNVTDLGRFFDIKPYPTPHSDIVALMVMEHQADAHNYLTRAKFETRLALHNREGATGEGAAIPDDAAAAIADAAEALVKHLLFCKETVLTEPIRGTSPFAEEFAAQGNRDRQGRSLRDFDLQRRLFKYPCSYLIYSASFDALPSPVKERVLRRLWEVLSGQDMTADFAHLSSEDRRAVLEILRETKADLPEYWR
jgi:hypothetical protein